MNKLFMTFMTAGLILSAILAGGCSAGNTTTRLPSVATTFVFTTQPAGAAPGKPFTTQPVVSVTDDYGNLFAGWSTPITLTITSGTGASGAKLSGTVSVTPAQGAATFSGLSIDLAGAVYRLTATSGTLRPASSIVFAVAAPASSAPASTPLATVAPTVAKTT
jgi:hypothetical protein